MHRHVARLLTASAMLGAVPATAQIVPPKIYSTTPTGVNLADTAFTYSETDIAIGPLKLERFYIGSYLNDPSSLFFGTHTSSNFDIYVGRTVKSPGRSILTVHLGASSGGSYETGSVTQIAANMDAEVGTLVLSGSNYVYTDTAGTEYTFSSSVPVSGGVGLPSSQRVSRIVFPDGRVQTFSYNGSNQLRLVSDSSGYALVFDWGANGRISAACGFNLSRTYVTSSTTCAGASLKTSYGYSGSLLTSVSDVQSNTTSYGWQTGWTQINCVTPPGYSGCKVANTIFDGKVIGQTLADGTVWTYSSNVEPGVITDEGANIDSDGQISSGALDPSGNGFGGTFTRSNPYSFTDGNGQTTQYRYKGADYYFDNDPPGGPLSEGSFLVEATYPEGNKYLAEYNGPYRALSKETLVAKPGSGLPNLVKQYGYYFLGAPYTITRQNQTKPAMIVDANGNQTDFTYATHGGVTSEMQPAPVAGAARPLKLYTYVQGYAYVKNSGGALVAAASPVWLPATETLCQTSAGSSTASCDPAAPITVTSYEYGASGTADNLLLRGLVVTSAGVSLRTCYGYDEYGNKIFETKPRAGLASCS